MRPLPSRLASLAALAAVWSSIAGVALAQTDPGGWTQFQGGEGHPGWVTAGPAPGYRTIWATRVATEGPRNEYGLSAPVLADGVAVAVGPTAVSAFDLSTGEVAWEIDRVLGPTVPPALATGPDGELVVFTEGWGDGPPDASETPSTSATPSTDASPSPSAGDDGSGETVPRLVAAPVGGGSPAWTLDLPDVSRTGVTVAADLALVGSIDGSVTAADVATGDVTWTADVGGVLDVAVAASDDLVFVSVRGDDDSGPALVALSLGDGSEAWRYEPTTGALSIGPPSVGDEAAFVALSDGTVHAVSLADGTEHWRTSVNAYVNPFSPASPPVVSGDAVVVADVRGQVYRLDAATGERMWDHAYNRPVLRSSPVVVGDHVLVASADGTLAAFELDGGDLVWDGQVADPDGVASSSPLRSVAASADTLVVVRGGADAGIAALAHDPDAALVRVASPTILDPPALLLAWAAGLAAAAVLFVVGRLLWARLGPPEIPTEGESDAEAEPEEDA